MNKKFVKKILSLLLVAILLISGGFPFEIFSGFTATAIGGNYYMINGRAVSYDSIKDTDADSYIKELYKYVWDVEFTNDFSSSDNILKNQPYEMRDLDAENLKTFVMRSQPGAVLKAETIARESVESDNGYCVFIVSFDANGLTVFEKTDERKESYYTWEQFCDIYAYSTIRFIKWPNSFFSTDVSLNETDYKKPDRLLYYDASLPLRGNDVRWVQQKLNDVGYSIGIDGYFGKSTEKVLKEFQKDFLLQVTGVVDAVTASVLDKPVKKPSEIEISLINKNEKDLSIGDILTVQWER